MVEIAPADARAPLAAPPCAARLAYGGDTLNTAVYLARAGQTTQFVTALGDDPLSDWLLEQWRSEGVDCRYVQREPGGVPGLYMIHTDEAGERSFSYWRSASPARRLLDDRARAQRLFAALMSSTVIYLSGITLAILGPTARARLFDFLTAYRAQAGGQIVFDNNYRAQLWPDVEACRLAFDKMYSLCDCALLTFDDEQLVFGGTSHADVLARLRAAGVDEIVLKTGAQGCTVASAAGVQTVPARPDIHVVDTTAAGDSFNAGYLAARLAGLAPAAAGQAGNELAAHVIGHKGAIVAR